MNVGASNFVGGNGLGIAITKGLVTLLGGNICLQSEIDKGSTFYFTIKTVIENDNNCTTANITKPENPDIFNWETV